MKLPLLAAACLLMAGCTSGGTEHVVVTVDHAVSLADQQVHLKVTGLRPNKPVSIGAETVDRAGRDGKRLAGTTLTRQWTSSGVTTTPLTAAKDKLTGLYVAPKADGAKHPAVLYFGGSEGGVPVMSIPLLLASHGYPVLAVAYFHAPGVPYLPHGTKMKHPLDGMLNLGGTRAADESAQRQGWTKTLALLASLQR